MLNGDYSKIRVVLFYLKLLILYGIIYGDFKGEAMNKLKHYLRLSQEALKKELDFNLRTLGMDVINEDGFLYAKGDIPILFVAHLDTVRDKKELNPPKKLNYNKKKDILSTPNGILGGDDRCGVYAIMCLLQDYRPHVLFTEDEESGLKGAFKTILKLKAPDVKYIVALDRRGDNHCVFYDCDNELFMKYIHLYGFDDRYGSLCDLSILGPAWDIATVNLSVGYYNEHTEDEYIKVKELASTINKVKLMFENIDKVPYFGFKTNPKDKPPVRIRR